MKAGFGISDITPRLGVQLAGYGPYRNRQARRVFAPLKARALALASGSEQAVLVSAELIGFDRRLDRRIRREIAARLRLADSRIVLVPTHTHSGPAIGGMHGWGEADTVYVETLPIRVALAAEWAWRSIRPVVWRRHDASLEGIAVNRETDEGYAAGADLGERLALGWRPAAPEDTDPTLRVLAAFARDGSCAGVVHQFACHPVVCGEQTRDVHGDFVGVASAAWERRNPRGVALFLPGAFGDINPCLNHRNPAESLRALRVLGGRYARALGRAVKASTPMSDQATLAVACGERVFGRQKRSLRSIRSEIGAIERQFRTPDADDRIAQGRPPLRTRGMLCAKLQGLRAIGLGFRSGRAPNPSVRLCGLRIGSVFLLGCGLEVFRAVWADACASLPGIDAWTVSLVGGMGYAADAAARRKGGYAHTFIPYVLGELPFKRIDRELPIALIRLQLKLR